MHKESQGTSQARNIKTKLLSRCVLFTKQNLLQRNIKLPTEGCALVHVIAVRINSKVIFKFILPQSKGLPEALNCN